MSENINIFFTINNGYSCYLATAMASILYNSKTDDKLCFFILDGGISEENKRKIALLNSIKPFEIEYLPIDIEKFKNMPKSSQAHISNETNYRFLISSLKPDIDKCIFIDADLVFDDDIEKLWSVDVQDNYLAAVVDQVPYRKGILNDWATKLPLPKDYHYVNTGVTVINLKQWRKDNIENKLFENVNKYSNLLKFPDQDILNITCAPLVKKLPAYFNAIPVLPYYSLEDKKEAFSNPVVIHWAGDKKPWRNPSFEHADYFWKYARMTPFYEEILYKNLKTTPIQQIIKTVDIGIIKDVANYSKNRFNYYRCKLLSKITFGKLRKHYKKKKKILKDKIRQVRRFLKGK